jgi:hypothetical protein
MGLCIRTIKAQDKIVFVDCALVVAIAGGCVSFAQ